MAMDYLKPTDRDNEPGFRRECWSLSSESDRMEKILSLRNFMGSNFKKRN
jgi:hypothetical protein